MKKQLQSTCHTVREQCVHSLLGSTTLETKLLDLKTQLKITHWHLHCYTSSSPMKTCSAMEKKHQTKPRPVYTQNTDRSITLLEKLQHFHFFSVSFCSRRK